MAPRSTRPEWPLVALALLVGGCGKDAPPPVGPQSADEPVDAGPALFEDVTAATALAFHHFSGATGDFLFAEILGAGVALLDYDQDGDLDVYLVQGAHLDPDADQAALFPPPAGHPDGNRLFRNELVPGGQLRFVDASEGSGADLRQHGMGATVGDIDNDGDPDIYVTAFGGNTLLRNDGGGKFTDVTESLNAQVPGWATSAAFFDYDRDGDLDLYVTNYVAWNLALDQRCTSASGNRDYCGPQNYTYLQDYLLRNDGERGFVDVSVDTGIAAARGPGLGVTAADFNGDGWTDIFVANDGEANFVWLNRDGRTFEEFGLMSGTAYNRDGSPEASMGVTAGDYDGDGDEDLFMTHLINETNTLYVNDGSGAFSDVTDRAGLGFGSKPYTGFGSAWFDYDNDGWLDLYIVNGDVKIEEHTSDNDYGFDQPNQLYRNNGKGRFEEIGERAGAAVSHSAISRGAAFGDIDNDGDTDIVVSNNSGPARLLQNAVGDRNPSLMLRLKGTRSNRDGYGARVAVLREGRAPLWRRVHADGSYLSSSDPRLLIGLGSDTGVAGVGVIWPNGQRERFAIAAGAREATLVEGAGEPWPES